MAECVDCLRTLKRGERGFSLCSPSGYACLCRECGERYPAVEALFARLRNEVRGASRPTPVGRHDPFFAA
jgi:hypothetical protein